MQSLQGKSSLDAGCAAFLQKMYRQAPDVSSVPCGLHYVRHRKSHMWHSVSCLVMAVLAVACGSAVPAQASVPGQQAAAIAASKPSGQAPQAAAVSASGAAPTESTTATSSAPAKDAAHGPSEWWMVGLTAALALFTMWLVLETRRLVAEAARTSQRQAREMTESLQVASKGALAAETAANAALAGQRPWIAFQIAVAGPVTYSPEGSAQFRFRVTAKNVGHAPAMGVRVHVHLNLLSPKHGHSIVQALKLADLDRGLPAQVKTLVTGDGTTLPYSETGVLLFPAEEHTITWQLSLRREEIDASCEDLKPHAHFFPEIVGLIAYTYPLAAVRAHTGFIAEVRRANVHQEFGTAFGVGEEVAAQDIAISGHSMWGSFAT